MVTLGSERVPSLFEKCRSVATTSHRPLACLLVDNFDVQINLESIENENTRRCPMARRKPRNKMERRGTVRFSSGTPQR